MPHGDGGHPPAPKREKDAGPTIQDQENQDAPAGAASKYSVYPKPQEGPSYPEEERSSGFFAREITAFLSGVMPHYVPHINSTMSTPLQQQLKKGVIVGLHGAMAYALTSTIWSSQIAAIAYTMSTVYLTGAFHEDGLADMFDGFGGGWTRESVLRIMRDSRVGTYGCLGLFLVVLLKIAGVVDLADRVTGAQGFMGASATGVFMDQHPLVWLLEGKQSDILSMIRSTPPLLRMVGSFVAAHVLGRWSCTYLLWRYPYVENHSAKGKEFLLKVTATRLFWTTLSAIAMLSITLLGVPAFWETLAGVFGVSCIVTHMMGLRTVKVIGGVIGDCLGATNQVVEMGTYLALCVDWGRAFVSVASLALNSRCGDEEL
ncbi:hypothetical protein HDU67_004941 [Dinochytrium kinnereticum]|nr:hypothetical protein HDU67_004941 [Dinochytrium kinnereticum]